MMKKIENQLIFISKFSGNPVTWATKKQTFVTTAITEAECVAAWMECKKGIWLTKLLRNMKIDVHLPIQIYEDNSCCIFIAKNPETQRSKHIDGKFHYLVECVWEKNI